MDQSRKIGERGRAQRAGDLHGPTLSMRCFPAIQANPHPRLGLLMHLPKPGKRRTMDLTDTGEAHIGYPRCGRSGESRGIHVGHPFFRIFCEMNSANRKLRTFSPNHQQRGRAHRRAFPVLLLGFSVPLLATVGGALFCRPGRASAEVKPRVDGVKQKQSEEQT